MTKKNLFLYEVLCYCVFLLNCFNFELFKYLFIGACILYFFLFYYMFIKEYDKKLLFHGLMMFVWIYGNYIVLKSLGLNNLKHVISYVYLTLEAIIISILFYMLKNRYINKKQL